MRFGFVVVAVAVLDGPNWEVRELHAPKVPLRSFHSSFSGDRIFRMELRCNELPALLPACLPLTAAAYQVEHKRQSFRFGPLLLLCSIWSEETAAAAIRGRQIGRLG